MFSDRSVLYSPFEKRPCWFGFTAEAEGAAADPSAESAAPDMAKDEPKGGVVERTPSVPAEMSLEEKTDDEGINSNKTSVESLREANENNSNNGGPRWQRGRCGGLTREGGGSAPRTLVRVSLSFTTRRHILIKLVPL